MASAAVVTSIHPRSARADNVELPSFVSPAYNAMQPRWKFCGDVMEGTEAIRRAENLDTYFPKGAVETTTEQTTRSLRAELFPMFKETVKGLVGLALRKDPVLSDDVPATIVNYWENIDGAGTAGPVFIKRVFQDALIKGHSGVLVDVPKITTSKALTIRQTKDLGLRPYAVHVKPEQIINWRTQVINGVVVLTLLVISEMVDVPQGTYGTQSILRYRVFVRDEATGLINYEIWTQQTHNKDPEFDSGGVLTATTRIPFAVCYAGERLAPLQSLPPLLDLAYTNIAHVQVLSDHRTALHACSNPILVTKGRNGATTVTPDPNAPAAPGQSFDNPAIPGVTPSAPTLQLGVNVGIDVDKDGAVEYVEHSGSALGASSQELKDIEGRGAAQGLSMLQRDTRQMQTAEAERLQRVEKDASLSSAVRSLQDMGETMLAFFALFMNETTGGSLELDYAFEDSMLDTPRIDAYSKMVAAGQLTRRTLWALLIKGGVLPDDFDSDAEEAALSKAEALTLTLPGNNTQPAGPAGSGPAAPPTSSAGADTGGGAPR